ncbi:hypothetical protein [Halomarina pelagica]|uniref:hypothetical protein n=1 Tax=Halomarina pelagica TaxID=2961599 RepID=UPI0020C1FB42|nr:hypothetical protein [Halomarina sp. BND7]
MVDGKPEWWRRNDRLRAEMELPPYEPSRFRDGTYAHEVVDPLEATHDCTLRFVGFGGYPADWEVRADGETLFTIGRHRDDNGNTVYEVDAAEFRRRVTAALA